jgi:hypothetical protein
VRKEVLADCIKIAGSHFRENKPMAYRKEDIERAKNIKLNMASCI